MLGLEHPLLLFFLMAGPSGCRSDIDHGPVIVLQAWIGSVLPDLSGSLSFDGRSNLQTVDTICLAVSSRGACTSDADLVASRP